MGERPEKQKLNLSVDKRVIERARSQNINISKLTEDVLKSITMDIEKTITEESIHKKYKELFDLIAPILKKFDASVKIGQTSDSFEDEEGVSHEVIFNFFLFPRGLEGWYVWMDRVEETVNLEYINLSELSHPKIILMELNKAITRGKEKFASRLKEIEKVKQIVKSMSDSINAPEGRAPTVKAARRACDV